MTSVLFICTGNVFRSLTAEYSLRAQLGSNTGVVVSSAGTRDDPNLAVRKDVSDYLLSKGLDVSSHVRTLVSSDLLQKFDHIIAMHTDHQQRLSERFSIEVPHFMEACGMKSEALPDVDDLFAPDDWHSSDAFDHIKRTIDRIVEVAPHFVQRTLGQGLT
ncbi:hypothetical protein [uncultured Roseobacter sp.]|uniref:arsenate-mycothiol transferase ArsC n=1 Tax=uncultured Roseobacter sp. TaxID=114847 RepID=UPI002607F64E|nr:hypothetical protein [uncultured Roseobacter sp.]